MYEKHDFAIKQRHHLLPYIFIFTFFCLFGKTDKNSDGKIDVTEFKELLELLPGKESESKINLDLVKGVEQLDSDHDSLISKEI